MQDATEQKKDKQELISIMQDSAGVANAAGLGLTYVGLFLNFFKDPAGAALTGVGATILFPMMVFAGAAKALLTWVRAFSDRRRQDNKMKQRHVIDAIFATLIFAAFTVALTGILAAAATFALATPIIFMVAIGAGILYHAAAAIHYARKSAAVNDNDPDRKEKYHSRAIEHAKSTGVGLISFVATTTVFLLGYLVLAPIGIAANAIIMTMCFIGIGLGIKHFIDKHKTETTAASETIADEIPQLQPRLKTPDALIAKYGYKIKPAKACAQNKKDKEEKELEALIPEKHHQKNHSNQSVQPRLFTRSERDAAEDKLEARSNTTRPSP